MTALSMKVRGAHAMVDARSACPRSHRPFLLIHALLRRHDGLLPHQQRVWDGQGNPRERCLGEGRRKELARSRGFCLTPGHLWVGLGRLERRSSPPDQGPAKCTRRGQHRGSEVCAWVCVCLVCAMSQSSLMIPSRGLARGVSTDIDVEQYSFITSWGF